MSLRDSHPERQVACETEAVEPLEMSVAERHDLRVSEATLHQSISTYRILYFDFSKSLSVSWVWTWISV